MTLRPSTRRGEVTAILIAAASGYLVMLWLVVLHRLNSFVNAGYFLQRVTFHGLETDIIASDGRAFRDPDGRPRAVRLAPSANGARSFPTGAAERYDCLLNMADAPAAPGTYLVTIESLDWTDPHPVVGSAATTIPVRP